MSARRRVPRGTLNRDVIVDAAVAVLDRDGPGAITTRAVAAQLGTDPTALYRHFRDKTDLLSAVGDRLLGDVGDVPEGAGWREALEALAGDLAVALTRRPGATELFARIPYSATTSRLVEQALAVLLRDGLAPQLAADALRAVVTLVFGHAAQRSPDVEEGFWAPLPAAAQPRSAFPAIHTTAKTWGDAPDTQLARELRLLLDGVAIRRRPV